MTTPASGRWEAPEKLPLFLPLRRPRAGRKLLERVTRRVAQAGRLRAWVGVSLTGASALPLDPAWGDGGTGSGGPWAICGWLGGRGLMMAVSGPPVAGPVVVSRWWAGHGDVSEGEISPAWGVMRP